VLNFLWILINLLCLTLTMYHLRKLYQDFTSSDLEAVRIISLFTSLPNLQYKVATRVCVHSLIQYVPRRVCPLVR
jgi:hypothetical protein